MPRKCKSALSSDWKQPGIVSDCAGAKTRAGFRAKNVRGTCDRVATCVLLISFPSDFH